MAEFHEMPKIEEVGHDKAEQPNFTEHLERNSAMVSGSPSSVLKGVSDRMVNSGVMPATDPGDLAQTLGDAAVALNNTDIGFSGDGGRSSGAAVSTILRAAGGDIEQTANIQDLNAQLKERGWTSEEYKPGDALKPGDLLFTSMNPQGRNVGIVGADGRIYSHSHGEGVFTGHDRWTSRFSTVMRAPSRDL